MSATQTRIRRGTAAQCDGMTPAGSEIIHDTTNNRLRVGNGATAGGIVLPNFSDIQKQTFGFGTAGGTANALTLTLAPALDSYSGGVGVEFLAVSDNTGASTININGLGAKNIYKMVEGLLTALEAGDIQSGGIYKITYDGTQFQIKGLDESSGGTKGMELLAIASGGGSVYDFTNDIDSSYVNYIFLIRNLTAASSSNLRLRTRRSGQPAFDSDSVYNYINLKAAGTAVTTTGGTSTSIVLAQPGVGGTVVNGIITASGLGNAGAACFTSELTVNQIQRHMAGGGNGRTNAMDGVRFFFETGNIAGGEIYLYGVKSTL